jgi:hypothetical protein
MKVIKNKRMIKMLHNKFIKALEVYKSEEIIALTGHKGNSYHKKVSYSKELDIWWDMGGISQGNSGDRFWNAFGIGKPVPKKLANIICEINYPTEGINKRVAAVWVQDKDEYILLHSGKIGGGRKGIGKNAFKKRYKGNFFNPDIEELSGEYIALSSIDNSRLLLHIKNYVFEVAHIKKEITQNRKITKKQIDLEKTLKTSFNDEFSGTKQYNSKGGKVTSNCDHGIVVRTLKNKIEAKGFNVANDQQRDLYIYNDLPKIKIVFEIKTSISSQTIFTAIGQLLVNNARLSPLPKLVFVIPETLNKNLLKTLKKLNIITLVYTWQNDSPVFNKLHKIL